MSLYVFFLCTKVDVYSFGNVLYVLLMLEWPFYEVDDYHGGEDDGDDDDDYSAFIGEKVVQGRRPLIPDDVRNSSNAIERALVMAFLLSQLETFDPGRLESWRGGTSRY
jgi:hypothetical protein